MLKVFSLKAKKALKQKGGFTLLELVVVIAIIAILALGVSVTAIRQIDRARVARVAADVSTAQTAMAMFNVDERRFPTDVEGLAILVQEGHMNRELVRHGFGTYSYELENGNPILVINFAEGTSQDAKNRVFAALTGNSNDVAPQDATQIKVNLTTGSIVE